MYSNNLHSYTEIDATSYESALTIVTQNSLTERISIVRAFPSDNLFKPIFINKDIKYGTYHYSARNGSEISYEQFLIHDVQPAILRECGRSREECGRESYGT